MYTLRIMYFLTWCTSLSSSQDHFRAVYSRLDNTYSNISDILLAHWTVEFTSFYRSRHPLHLLSISTSLINIYISGDSSFSSISPMSLSSKWVEGRYRVSMACPNSADLCVCPVLCRKFILLRHFRLLPRDIIYNWENIEKKREKKTMLRRTVKAFCDQKPSIRRCSSVRG